MEMKTVSRMPPVDSFLPTEVTPNGDRHEAVYAVRHTISTTTYRNYHPAGPAAAEKK